jgi:FkbM family methyltransferase
MRRPDAHSFFEFLSREHPEWCEVIVDIGVERDSPFLRENFPRSRHILVECEKSYHPQIKERYQGIDHELVYAGVGPAYGNFHLFKDSIRADGELTHTFLETDATRAAARIAKGHTNYELVDVIPADHLYRTYRPPDRKYITKIDIDGIELDVIEASDLLFPNSAIVMVECPLWLKKGFATRFWAAERKGLRLIDIVSPCYYKEKLWQVDLIFINEALQPGFHANPHPVDPSRWQGSW